MSTLLLAIGSLAISSPSFALIQGELGAGQKTVSFDPDSSSSDSKKKNVSGTELNASIMLDPIPVVPISFGLVAQSYAFDFGKAFEDSVLEDTPSATYSGSYKMAGLLYGLGLKVWAPIPFIKPYLKFAYLTGSEVARLDYIVASSTNDSTAVSGSQTLTHTGTDLCLGIGYSPIKFFQLFVEYAIHSGKSQVKSQDIDYIVTTGGTPTAGSITSDDLTDEDKKSETANAKSIRLGLSVGI